MKLNWRTSGEPSLDPPLDICDVPLSDRSVSFLWRLLGNWTKPPNDVGFRMVRTRPAQSRWWWSGCRTPCSGVTSSSPRRSSSQWSANKRSDLLGGKFKSVNKRSDLSGGKFKSVNKRSDLSGRKFKSPNKHSDLSGGKFKSVNKRSDLLGGKFKSVNKRSDLSGGKFKSVNKHSDLSGGKFKSVNKHSDLLGGKFKSVNKRSDLSGGKFKSANKCSDLSGRKFKSANKCSDLSGGCVVPNYHAAVDYTFTKLRAPQGSNRMCSQWLQMPVQANQGPSTLST